MQVQLSVKGLLSWGVSRSAALCPPSDANLCRQFSLKVRPFLISTGSYKALSSPAYGGEQNTRVVVINLQPAALLQMPLQALV